MSALATAGRRFWPPARPLGGAYAVAAGAAIAAFIVGVVIGHSAKYGLGLAIGLCFLPIAVLNLPLALVLWVPFAFLNRLPLAGAPTAAGLVMLLAWVGAARPVGSRIRVLLRMHRNTIALLVAMLAWAALSLAWAQDKHLAWQNLRDWLSAVVVVILLISTLSGERLAMWTVWAVLVGGALSVLAGLVVHPPPPGGLGSSTSSTPGAAAQFGGAEGDPNVLSAGLVAVLGLSALMAVHPRRGWRLAILITVVPTAFGFAASGSRGGLIGALVAAAAALVLGRGRRKQILLILGLVAVLAAGWFVVHPATFQRITTLDESGDGRTTLWTVALRMWTAHPFAGVGIGNFPVRSVNYIQRPGLLTYASFIIKTPKVTHNSYLQTLAELGVIGVALYCAAVFACLRAALRAARVFADSGRDEMAYVARGVFVGALAMLTALFFISFPADLRLWAVLALGPILEATAVRSAAAHASSRDVRAGAGRSAALSSRPLSHGRRRSSSSVQGSHARP